MGETEVLAAYLAEATFEDLPGEVVSRAKHSFGDTVACGLGGRKTRDADVLLDAMRYLGGEGEATVIGEPARLPFLSAAQVNRVICNALDYDDTHMKAGHLSSALVPVALNVGEKLNASGKDVLNALVLGYEVVSRVRSAVDPSEETFWKTFERVDSGLNLGVTAVAGKLFGLDAGQMADALGLAGHVRSWRITFPDRAARGMPPWMKITGGDTLVPGVHSVLLAQRGFPGDRGLLDQGRGYEASVGSDRYDARAIVAGLGRRYETLRLGYKLYPSCRHTSTSAEAVAALVAEHGIRAEDVERVLIHVQKHTCTNFAIYEPSSMIQAQFSVPYVVSMVLMGVPTGPGWYADEMLRDPRARALQRTVELREDPVATRRFYAEQKSTSTVEITTRAGGVFRKYVEYPRGEPEKPFGPEEHRRKLTEMAAVAGLSRERTGRLVAALGELDRLESVRALGPLLVPSGEGVAPTSP